MHNLIWPLLLMIWPISTFDFQVLFHQFCLWRFFPAIFYESWKKVRLTLSVFWLVLSPLRPFKARFLTLSHCSRPNFYPSMTFSWQFWICFAFGKVVSFLFLYFLFSKSFFLFFCANFQQRILWFRLQSPYILLSNFSILQINIALCYLNKSRVLYKNHSTRWVVCFIIQFSNGHYRFVCYKLKMSTLWKKLPKITWKLANWFLWNAAKMQQNSSKNSVKIQSKYSQNTYSQNAVKMQSLSNFFSNGQIMLEIETVNFRLSFVQKIAENYMEISKLIFVFPLYGNLLLRDAGLRQEFFVPLAHWWFCVKIFVELYWRMNFNWLCSVALPFFVVSSR